MRSFKFDNMAKNAHVFIVEDEASIAEALLFNLEMEGYDCTVISTGTQAMERLEDVAQCDLGVLDKMSGGCCVVQLCQVLRKISDVPVIFLSAKSTGSDRIEGLKSGADD